MKAVTVLIIVGNINTAWTCRKGGYRPSNNNN